MVVEDCIVYRSKQAYNMDTDITLEVEGFIKLLLSIWGGEIAQLLTSLSIKRAVRVRAQLNPLVIERWNSIKMLSTCLHQYRRLVH